MTNTAPFAIVLCLPSFGSRDEFTGNRYHIESTHDTAEAAHAALNARFDAMTEEEFEDFDVVTYVAETARPWAMLGLYDGLAPAFDNVRSDDIPF